MYFRACDHADNSESLSFPTKIIIPAMLIAIVKIEMNATPETNLNPSISFPFELAFLGESAVSLMFIEIAWCAPKKNTATINE